ncbi:hypothetical protein D9758_017072 [Tetrapyrgos nigripes]|uniref:CCHC-type domain-containing protein n=1 Tax=Tetrapyrgos nigripes TaxID=182062 RepID=A0A8H5CFJ1_9AGAR|nr:hypothetical protein D9758_017072 [Tetrapyrgos nigripes]
MQFFLSFEEWKEDAKLNEEGLIMLLKQNLWFGIVQRIYQIDPVPVTYAAWKAAAVRLNLCDQSVQTLRNDSRGIPASGNTSVGTWFTTAQTPTTTTQNATTSAGAPSEAPMTCTGTGVTFGGQGKPMEIDCTKANKWTWDGVRKCYGCGEEEHISRNCLNQVSSLI